MEKPCCPASAARKIKKLNIEGFLVSIIRLEETFKKVFDMRIEDEEEVKKELLKQAKIYNYVPPKSEKEYEKALFKEYQEFRSKREND